MWIGKCVYDTSEILFEKIYYRNKPFNFLLQHEASWTLVSTIIVCCNLFIRLRYTHKNLNSYNKIQLIEFGTCIIQNIICTCIV